MPGASALQVQLRRHAVHRVDHAAELRDEERVHHARRGQGEVNRHAGGDHELVDAGDVLVRVDEQPLPIQRNALDLQRRRVRCQRLGRIELVRSDPGHAAQQHDHQQRDGPDDQLDAAGIGQIRQIGRPRVGGPEPPGEGQRRDDRRHHDGQHDRQRVDQDRLLGNPDGALRVEHGGLTGGQSDRRDDDGVAPGRHSHRAMARRKRLAIRQSVWLGGHRAPPHLRRSQPVRQQSAAPFPAAVLLCRCRRRE